MEDVVLVVAVEPHGSINVIIIVGKFYIINLQKMARCSGWHAVCCGSQNRRTTAAWRLVDVTVFVVDTVVLKVVEERVVVEPGKSNCSLQSASDHACIKNERATACARVIPSGREQTSFRLNVVELVVVVLVVSPEDDAAVTALSDQS